MTAMLDTLKKAAGLDEPHSLHSRLSQLMARIDQMRAAGHAHVDAAGAVDEEFARLVHFLQSYVRSRERAARVRSCQRVSAE